MFRNKLNKKMTEKDNNLLPLAKHIRKTLMDMNDLIQVYELPYKINLEFDIEHKNWEEVSEVHLR